MDNDNRTLITGATGLIGRKLVSKIISPIIVSRTPESARKHFPGRDVEFLEWNSLKGRPDLEQVAPIHRVVNLMGVPIADKRWNAQRKKMIRESRVDGTRKLVESIRNLPKLPTVFVSASAIGIYGNRADEILTESSFAGDDGFLVDVCRDWEAEANKLSSDGVRVVIIRIGLVISKKGGALNEMLPFFRWGVGGRLGSGKQWMSWIHVDDLADLFLFALNQEHVSGVLNGTAPEPARNSDFTRQLAKTIHRPAILPAPRFGLKMVLGEFADCLLESQRAIPERTEATGFQFKYRNLQSALDSELGSRETGH